MNLHATKGKSQLVIALTPFSSCTKKNYAKNAEMENDEDLYKKFKNRLNLTK